MNVVKVMKTGLMVSVLLTFGCGDNANPKGSGSNNPTPVQPGPDSPVTPTPRDVRAECVSELVRLEGCGQATADERDYLETEFCQSTDFTDGQVATVASCLAQWTCGGAMPACLEDSNPAPECVEDTACPFEHQCRSGVCQPSGGSNTVIQRLFGFNESPQKSHPNCMFGKNEPRSPNAVGGEVVQHSDVGIGRLKPGDSARGSRDFLVDE